MSYETVELIRDGAVAVVKLNRPQKMNTFNARMRRELWEAVREVNADTEIRVVILAAAGRAFCAGADLTEEPQANYNVIDLISNEYKPILMAITEARKPWISAVQGAGAGIGGAFAMNCDLTVMADNGYLYQAFAAIGLVPDGGSTWHLANALGRKRAYEFIVTGEKVSAEKCLDLGLCNRVVPVDELMSATMAWAQELARKAPLSLRYSKQLMNSAVNATVGDTISDEARLQHLCDTSEDAIEGGTAFFEKREPKFKGR